jgi:hypothetical protein
LYKKFRRKIKKVFREILLYHNNSLEYRAKILTLVVAVNGKITPCEEELLLKTARDIYNNDEERSEILVDAVKEYFEKIKSDNGLNFEDLIFQVEKETKEIKRFVSKIDIEALLKFQSCLDEEEDRVYQQRVISYLADLKEQYK